tara:strand:- start:382 stop:579 length:198 start_codon:yes stop_codon:yes gene_type:complete
MNIAKCARATEIMNKVKGGNPFVFSNKFLSYNEAKEGIRAQQAEADRRLQQILSKKNLTATKMRA